MTGTASADTLIHAGRLIDVDAGRAYNDQTIRIDGDTISGIESGFTTPGDGDTLIDLSQSTVMPGLMDMHVHLTGQYSANSNLNRFVLNEADYAFDAVDVCATNTRCRIHGCSKRR